MIEGSGSGSVSLTNGSRFRSGRPKNIWILRIRIRIRNTGFFKLFFAVFVYSVLLNGFCFSCCCRGTLLPASCLCWWWPTRATGTWWGRTTSSSQRRSVYNCCFMVSVFCCRGTLLPASCLCWWWPTRATGTWWGRTTSSSQRLSVPSTRWDYNAGSPSISFCHILIRI